MEYYSALKRKRGTSLVVRWLRLCAPTAGGTGSISGGGTKIPHAAYRGQRNKTKPAVCNNVDEPGGHYENMK